MTLDLLNIVALLIIIYIFCSRCSDEIVKDTATENWLVQLFGELEKQGINLPERYLFDSPGAFLLYFVAVYVNFRNYVPNNFMI